MSPDWANAVASAVAAIGGVGSAIVALRTYRRQYSDSPVGPREPSRVMASATISPSRTSDPVRRGGGDPAASVPTSTGQDGQVRPAVILLGVATVAALTAIWLAEPAGFLWGTVAVVTVGWIVAAGGALWLRSALTRRRQAAGRQRSPFADVAGGTLAVLLAIVALGTATVLVRSDYWARVDDCLVGQWTVASHVFGYRPVYHGKGATLRLGADGNGMMTATDATYEGKAGSHTYRRHESFAFDFLFLANEAKFRVDSFSRSVGLAEVQIDGKSWETETAEVRFPASNYGSTGAYSCAGNALTITGDGFGDARIEATRVV